MKLQELVMEQQVAEGAQHLCKACGLCCRGVWFSHGNLEPDEVVRAREAGMNIGESENNHYFKLRCPLHGEEGCSAYKKWRPSLCASYICALLKSYNKGEISFDAALAYVKEIRVVADRLQGKFDALEGGMTGRHFIAKIAGHDNGTSSLTVEEKLDALALRVHFDRHFAHKSARTKE